MSHDSTNTGAETGLQRLERALSLDAFQGLKALLDKLSPDREVLRAWVEAANSYEELLAKLGYKLNLTKQIHVQDCYSRLGPAGGIRAVLPYHDVPTHSSFPMLVNFDHTVTITPKGLAFFSEMFAAFKRQLNGQA